MSTRDTTATREHTERSGESPPMLPGVASFSFEVLPLEPTLMIARELGFERVDIAGFSDRGRCSFEPAAVARDPEGQARVLLPLLERYRLAVSDYFVQFGAAPSLEALNSPDEAVLKRNLEMLKGAARFAALIGSPGITVLPGVDHGGRRDTAELDRAGEALRRAMEITSAEGIQLRFEPHMGSVADTPELALAIIGMVPELTVTLDVAHFTLQYIPLDRVLPLIAHTGHVHVRQAKAGTLQVAWEEGTIDFPRILRELSHRGYAGTLTVEYVCADWYGVNRNDTLHESMRAGEALREMLHALS
ncbi:MAG: sugar phosphate isomerase/epimerase [Spirochaetaceae bacterium]|nr:MAG: sugar phosphate isomerase/epimerase [Spirochaetaceae bacterium]